MSLDTTPITETDAYTAAIYGPLAGSTPIASDDVIAPLQALANRTKNLDLHKVDSVGGTMSGTALDPATLHGTIEIDDTTTVSIAAGAKLQSANDPTALVDFKGTTTLEGTNNLKGTTIATDDVTFDSSSSVVFEGQTSLDTGCEVIHNGEVDLHFVPAARLAWGAKTFDSTVTNPRAIFGTVSATTTGFTITLQDSTSNVPPDGKWHEISIAQSTNTNGAVISIVRQTPSTGGAKIATLTCATLSGGARKFSTIRVAKDHSLGEWVVESAGNEWDLLADAF